MAVLKTTSPVVSTRAPKDSPRKTPPSSSARMAGGRIVIAPPRHAAMGGAEAEGGYREGLAFAVPGVGGMLGGEAVVGAVGARLDGRDPVSLRAQRRIHLGVGAVLGPRLVVEHPVVWAGLSRDV